MNRPPAPNQALANLSIILIYQRMSRRVWYTCKLYPGDEEEGDDFWEYWYVVFFRVYQVTAPQSDSHPTPFLHTLTNFLARKIADWVSHKCQLPERMPDNLPYRDHALRIADASVEADRHGTFQLELPVFMARLLVPHKLDQLLAVVTAWATAEPVPDEEFVHDDDSDTVLSVEVLRPRLHKIALPNHYWGSSDAIEDALRLATQQNRSAPWVQWLTHTERDMQRTLQAFGQPGPGSMLSLITEREQGRHPRRPEVREVDEHRWQARILYDLLTKVNWSARYGASPQQIEKQADWMGQAAAIMEDGARDLVVSLGLVQLSHWYREMPYTYYDDPHNHSTRLERRMVNDIRRLANLFRRLGRL
jgi:hypothetical protein